MNDLIEAEAIFMFLFATLIAVNHTRGASGRLLYNNRFFSLGLNEINHARHLELFHGQRLLNTVVVIPFTFTFVFAAFVDHSVFSPIKSE